MATKTLSVVITGDANGAQKAFQQTTKSSDDLATKLESTGKKMASVGKNLSIGITAPVVAFAAVGFKELEDSGKVAAQTEAAIRSTGGAANVTAKQVDGLAQSLMSKSGIDDEAIKSGENLLLTFKGIRNESGKGNDIFNQATKATLDLSVAFGKDMTQSAVLVGKALNDPIKGVTALTRVGVTFTQGQKDQIKSLVESGDVMGAQKVILQELTSEVGGSAAAYGDTMAGQVSKAKEELKNAAAAMVTVAAPAIKFLGDRAMELAGFLSDLPGPAKTAVGAFAAVAASIGPVLFIGGKLMQLAKGISTAWSAVSDAFVAVERAAVNAFTAVEGEGTSLAVTAGATVAAIGAVVGAAALIGYPLHLIFGDGGEMQKALDGLAKAKAAGKGWADSIIAGAKMSAAPIDELRSRLDTLRSSQDAELTLLKAHGGTFEDAIAVHAKYQGAIEGVKGAIQQEKQAESEGKAEALARYIALLQLSDGTTTLTTTTEAGRKAIQDFNNTILAAAGGPIAYQQAVANQTAAQDALNKAITDYGPFSAEAAAASLALQNAQLGVSQAANQQDTAQAALTKSLSDGNTTYDQQLGLLNQQLIAHPENAAGIMLEKQALDRAKEAADAIPGSKSVVVTADTWDAESKLNRVHGFLQDITSGSWGINVHMNGA